MSINPQPPPGSPWQAVMDFLRYVLASDEVFKRFRQIVWLLAGVALVLAGVAVVALTVAPQSTIAQVLTGAAVTGVASTAGGVATYRSVERRRARRRDLPSRDDEDGSAR